MVLVTDGDGVGQDGPRYDEQGRRLCTAKRKSDGDPCEAPAMAGQRVCRMHGGSTRKARNAAKLRLMDLVDPAITMLGRELVSKTSEPKDRLAAANSILDRAGLSRRTDISVDDARDLLVERIMANRAAAGQGEDGEGSES